MDASSSYSLNSIRHLNPENVDSSDDASKRGGQVDGKNAQSLSSPQPSKAAHPGSTGTNSGLNNDTVAEKLNATLPPGLSPFVSEEEFRAQAMKAGLNSKVCDEIVTRVHEYVQALLAIDPNDQKKIDGLKQRMSEAVSDITDKSKCRQAKTVITGGAVGYLSSFFFGKLFTNIFMVGLAQPHNGWAFLTAGLLNTFVSEPLVQGIRGLGAVYASPDGKAYADYHSAQQWLKEAVRNNDKAGIKRWRSVMNGIVDSVIKRETSKGIKVLGSGIKKIFRDESSGEPTRAFSNKARNVDGHWAERQVIAAARRRAFISDELSFHTFSCNYAITGAVAPLLKSVMPLWSFVLSDLMIGAAFGTLSGVQMASLQNILRWYVQGADLVAQPLGDRTKQLEAARSVERIWEDRLARLAQVRIALRVCRTALLETKKKALQEQKPVPPTLIEAQAKLKEYHAKARQDYKTAKRKLRNIKWKYNTSTSRLERVGQSVKDSWNSYMGEVGPNPGPIVGLPATYRQFSKLIGYPLSLAPFVAWIAYGIPAIVAAAYPATNATGGLNHTSLHGLNESLPGMAPAVQGDPGFEAAKMGLQMGLGALSGLVLIIGFTTRAQYLSQWAESSLVRALGSAARERRRPEVQEKDDDEVNSVSDTESEVSMSEFSEETVIDDDFESESGQSSGDSSSTYISFDDRKKNLSGKDKLKSVHVDGGASESESEGESERVGSKSDSGAGPDSGQSPSESSSSYISSGESNKNVSGKVNRKSEHVDGSESESENDAYLTAQEDSASSDDEASESSSV